MFNFQLSRIPYLASLILLLSSCSIQQKITKSAKRVINDSSLLTAHVGISIYEPATGKYWYNYQGDKYFVPASNTKLPTCYAAMKYLGDSLVGLRYRYSDYLNEYTIIPTGDPTFLHKDFPKSKVFDFLKQNKDKKFSFNITNTWFEHHWGNGWAWNDFDANYMAERSPFPIYGNVVFFKRIGDITLHEVDSNTVEIKGLLVYPKYFKRKIKLYDDIKFETNNIQISRELNGSVYNIRYSNQKYNSEEIPFSTGELKNVLQILKDTIDINWSYAYAPNSTGQVFNYEIKLPNLKDRDISYKVIHSQPTDSLLKPMMHNSDNFFAEQSLLMVSNERLGVMNDAKTIDTLLKTDFKDLPQKPRWVDGSGLSRYNLFTPQDFVAILNKMKNEFGMERIKVILPTGGEGTISSYYKADSNYIFVKTGTLSGVVALSGFLYTKKGKLLIFSTLVNNHQASATAVRRAVEKFIEGIRNQY